MNRNKSVIIDCLYKNRFLIVFFVIMSLFNGTIFFLYDIIREAFVYAELMLFFTLIILLVIDFAVELKFAREREHQNDNIFIFKTSETEQPTLRDRDYCKMIDVLNHEIERLQADFSQKKQADDDYYTSWVHQIKTPIAAMKLQLTDDTAANKALSSELFRIEQYVEMVLDYVRLESETHDLIIREYSIDELIRETLRKFAPQFIMRKLKLSYEPTEKVVITDKKWLVFILEQLISNAIKYTPSGEIRILVDGDLIKISDTGIGIVLEDLPMIFEKGYTGTNGRLGHKSSGLGLFLTKKAAQLLAVSVTAESTPGVGSTFIINLNS